MLYFGYIVPYGFLIVVNVLIIYKATSYERGQKSVESHSKTTETRKNKRKAQMTRAILILTFIFIMATLPSTIITGYLYDEVIHLEIGQIIINLIDGIQFSYPAFNFFILFFSNKLFEEQVRNLLVIKMKTNKISASTRFSENNNNSFMQKTNTRRFISTIF